MPIPLPNLDDRRWTDLVDEGRAAIPRDAPAWTDHNVHDPGITLIDLFAWLTEMTVFGLNRITARHKRKFLALVNSRPLDPSPAHVMLGFTPAASVPTVLVPAGIECEGVDVDGTIVPFRTRRDVTVSQISLAALQVDAMGDGTLVNRTQDLRDRLPIAPLGLAPRAAESSATPDGGAACYFGFDTIATGVPVTLGFQFAGSNAGGRNDARERARIIEEAAAQVVACRPVTTRLHCGLGGADTTVPTSTDLPLHHSARLVWEAFTARGWIALSAVSPDTPPAPEQVFDDTRAFTLDGIVELNCPADLTLTAVGGISDALFYLRARIVAGALDAAPRLLDLTLNAVVAEQAVPTKIVVAIGTGTGLPDQAVTLREAPVVAASLRLTTDDGTTVEEWRRRDDFDAAVRTDTVFVLDPTSGLVTFGSCERGRMPEPGAAIFASYLATKADRGNVAASIVTRFSLASSSSANAAWLSTLPTATQDLVVDPATFAIANQLAAIDGTAAESLDSAIGRAVEVLHAHERLLNAATEQRVDTLDRLDRAAVRALRAPARAVNLLDLERVALATPGTHIARARAWASLHPRYQCLDAPGVVTLVVVPEAPPERPAPSDGLLDAVWRYLDRRRMICTKLQIVGPSYVEVTVTASVQARVGISAAKMQARIDAALRAFLDPLTGGSDGLGWPFGRAVYRTEIMHVIDGVPGVDHVTTLSLTTDAGPAQCGDLVLCPTALVYSGLHQIEVA
jgi:predicted phage baseplate assembly protein